MNDGPALSGRLLRGERILWSGRPAQGLAFSPQDWLLVPFSAVWAGFALSWEFGVLTTRAPDFFAVFGVPFVLVGLFMLAGRFAVDAWIRRSTAYAVTNQRILILRSRPSSTFMALPLDRLPEASLIERVNGSGSIRFGPAPSPWGRNAGFASWMPALNATPQFIGIEHARRVFDLIQQATSHPI